MQDTHFFRTEPEIKNRARINAAAAPRPTALQACLPEQSRVKHSNLPTFVWQLIQRLVPPQVRGPPGPACFRVFSSACFSAERVSDGWFWVSGSPPGMAGAGTGILTLRPSPRYCYQPGMASGFAGASAVHQGLLRKESPGRQHCWCSRGIHPPGHPSSPPWDPQPLWGLSHCVVTLELFQRLCENHTSLLPSFPHVHPLP